MDAVKPRWIEVRGRVDEVRRPVAFLANHLHQALTVAAARAADDDHAVDIVGGEYRGLLAFLGCATDLVVDLDGWEALHEAFDDRLRVPHAQRRLARDRERPLVR